MQLTNPPKAWQKLLCHALQDTDINIGKGGRCNLFNIRHYIYQSLQNSGIQNRSPFSLWQLVKISNNSKGNPQQVRKLCIKSVLSMSKPSFCLLSSHSYLASLIIILSLVTLLTPITATTFKSPNSTESILKIKILPWQDLENDSISIPYTSDYLMAATDYKITVEDKQLADINGASWILEQQNSAYSLQLLSVSNKANLLSFCKKHNICNKSAFYSTRVNGQNLVRLIYGSYHNHKAAKLAKLELPESLKGTSPWARSFKKIKNEL